MEKILSDIIAKIREAGGRTTPLRRGILECLLEFGAPMSVPKLTQKLESRGFSPNKTTIYRQLATLSEHDAIETVKLDASTQLFEIKRGHHHHFMCDNCDEVIDVDAPEIESALHKFEKELEKRNLKVTKHEFALYGLCNECN